MGRQKLTDVVRDGTVLVSDGAWGTALQARGLKPGECPELWCIEHPDEVVDVAANYIAAGADLVETNSFGGNQFKLEYYGLAEQTTEINRAAAELSRTAAGEHHWVMASIGPTGKMLITEEVTPEELYETFRTQAEAFAAGGADAVCIETMSDMEEASLAIRAVKEHTSLEVICTFTFDRTVRGDYRTMMGLSPQAALSAAAEAGADIIGTNCGNGMERMVEIIHAMRQEDENIPLMVQANAGLPQNVNGQDIFPDTPEDMAKFVPDLIQSGVRIIGGCCGTTPEHIRAIKQAVMNYQAKQ